MKVIAKENPNAGFKPRSLEIVFESQSELNAFGALFNIIPVADAMLRRGINPHIIRARVKEIGGDCVVEHDALGIDMKGSFQLWRKPV